MVPDDSLAVTALSIDLGLGEGRERWFKVLMENVVGGAVP